MNVNLPSNVNPGMENELLNRRIIFLGGTVENSTANHIIVQLVLLGASSPGEPIDLYINSNGGSVSAGLAIIDAMNACGAPVHTLCIGMAASMGACLVAAGTPGERRITPNAEVMLHQMSGQHMGFTSDMLIHVEHMARQQERMVEMMSQWTGKSVGQIKADMDRDFFLTAEEALAYGIVDEILKPAGT